MKKHVYVDRIEKRKGLHTLNFIKGNNPYHTSLTNLPTIMWTPKGFNAFIILGLIVCFLKLEAH